MTLKTICLVALASTCASVNVSAMEVTAGGSLDVQANWTALKNMIDAANTRIGSLQADIGVMKSNISSVSTCGTQGKVWNGTNCVNAQYSSVIVNSTSAWRGRDGYGASYADGEVACPGGTKLVAGGGYCDSGDGGLLFGSMPWGNGWRASCRANNTAGNGATAVAVCQQL